MQLIAGICCVGAPNCNKELAGTDLNEWAFKRVAVTIIRSNGHGS